MPTHSNICWVTPFTKEKRVKGGKKEEKKRGGWSCVWGGAVKKEKVKVL